ncbi:MAG: hypothetical protein IK115_05590 [Lachnospiraceae bacterium]|nr:hypothetical protein [Lachnospiraceae bacterium]
MNTKERYRELDLYKGVGILLVVTHATQLLSESLEKRVAAVGFALFMAAAGALYYKKGYKQDEKVATAEVFRGIFMPYIWFSLAFLCVDALGMFILPERFTLENLYGHIWDSVSFLGISTLWFLPAYFLAVAAYRMFRFYFSFVWMAVILTLTIFCLLLILYYRGYDGMLPLQSTEPGLENYGLRFALLFWRGSLGMFFCMWGEALARLEGFLKKKKIICVTAALAALVLGAVLAGFAPMPDYENFALGNPFLSIPIAMCFSGGLYILCCWIGTVRPIDFLGRHALIILVSYNKFKVLFVALALGGKVLALTQNNFATRTTVALVTLGLELLIIFILRQPVFRIFFGMRDWSAPAPEEPE